MISHRDLLRLFERLLRRAELKLKMSEGFHPKAKLSFPSALALGIEGLDEVMEVELAEAMAPSDLLQQLQRHAPQGLEILAVRRCGPDEKKAQVAVNHYHVAVPDSALPEVARALEQLMAESSCLVSRDDGREPLDARRDLVDASLHDAVLHFSLRASRSRGVRPREILEILGLGRLEETGRYLSRRRVQLQTTSPNTTKETETT